MAGKKGDEEDKVEKPKADELSVDPPAKDEDDDESGVKAVETPEQRETRRERRRERGRLRDDAKAATDRADRLERELSEHRARTDREIQMLRMERLAEKDDKGKEDPIQREVDAVHAEEDALLARWRGLTPEQQEAGRDDYVNKMRAVERKKYQAYAKGAQPAQQPQMNEAQHAQMMLRGKYPQVYANQGAIRWANAQYNLRVAEGGQDSTPLAEEVMRDAMVRYNLGTPPGASDAERRRHISIGKGAGAGGNGKPRTIAMTKEYNAMADAAYSHVKDEKTRRAKWAQEVGPGLLDDD